MPESSSTPWCYAVHSIKSGLMIIRPDGIIDQINDSLKTMVSKYGVSPDFMWRGISFFELPPEIFGRSSYGEFFETTYLPSIKDVMLGKSPQYTVEYSVDWSGRTIWTLCEAYPIAIEMESAPLGLVISFSDITRYKQKELRLERALSNSCSLHGHVPICAVCKHIRTADVWEPVESYLESRMSIEFTHDICPTCIRRLYPKYSSILDEPHTSTEE